MGKGLGRCDSGSGTEDPRRQEGDTRRSLSQPRLPRWSQGGGQGGDFSSGAPSSLTLTKGTTGSLVGGAYSDCGSGSRSGRGDIAPSTAVNPCPGPRVGDPIRRWLPSLSREAEVSGWDTVGTLGGRWWSRPEVVGQYPDGVSLSALSRRRPGRRLLASRTPLIPALLRVSGRSWHLGQNNWMKGVGKYSGLAWAKGARR